VLDAWGGDVGIRGTLIPVWVFVGYRQGGMGDAELLADFPGLGV